MFHAAYTDFSSSHLLDHGFGPVLVGLDGDQDDFKRFGHENTLNRVHEFVTAAFKRRDDDGDMLWGKSWIFRNRNRLQSAKGIKVDDQAKVTIDAMGGPVSDE